MQQRVEVPPDYHGKAQARYYMNYTETPGTLDEHDYDPLPAFRVDSAHKRHTPHSSVTVRTRAISVP